MIGKQFVAIVENILSWRSMNSRWEGRKKKKKKILFNLRSIIKSWLISVEKVSRFEQTDFSTRRLKFVIEWKKLNKEYSFARSIDFVLSTRWGGGGRGGANLVGSKPRVCWSRARFTSTRHTSETHLLDKINDFHPERREGILNYANFLIGACD